jgi:hypothetical protein
MSKPVRLDADAHEELEAAVAWYDGQTGRRDVGDRLLAEVGVALQRIGDAPATFPLAGGVPAERCIRRCVLRTFPTRSSSSRWMRRSAFLRWPTGDAGQGTGVRVGDSTQRSSRLPHDSQFQLSEAARSG